MPRPTHFWTLFATLSLLAAATAPRYTHAQDLTRRLEAAEVPLASWGPPPARPARFLPASGGSATSTPVLPTHPDGFQQEYVDPNIAGMAAAGALFGVAGAAAGALAAVSLTSPFIHDEWTGLGVGAVGLVVGGALTPPIAVHAVNGRRGTLGWELAGGAAVGAASLGTAALGAPFGVIMVESIVGSALVSAVIEAATTPEPVSAREQDDPLSVRSMR